GAEHADLARAVLLEAVRPRTTGVDGLQVEEERLGHVLRNLAGGQVDEVSRLDLDRGVEVDLRALDRGGQDRARRRHVGALELLAQVRRERGQVRREARVRRCAAGDLVALDVPGLDAARGVRLHPRLRGRDQLLAAAHLALHQAGRLGELDRVLRLRLDQVVQVATGEERLLRGRDDDAGDVVLLRFQPVDDDAERLAEVGVHRVRRLLRVVERQHDDAVGVLLPADGLALGHFFPHTRSMMVATPMPPPMQRVTSARRAWRRSSSSTTVPTSIAPVAPSGWPIAIAPPLTLTFSSGRRRSLIHLSTTEANASLSSHRSMSSGVSPAIFRTFSVAGVGPVSMMVGSEPTVAVATIRARGVSPNVLPICSEPSSTSAAPSTMPEEFPPVWTCTMRSIE